ncbi:hypothetical protein L2E82_17134 [Cichorium intybus]|uniref:Uncharacterized protein n=1 Tax=Cichorium intybus TaxID=13427 RepID=A0ACB9F835_CICIN|nr:hypothetical protein L2E82_17134 [Cichorium intybus]
MDAAASMIEKAIVANPTYAKAYNNLRVLYRDAGSISLAIEAYEQCLKIDPDSRNAGRNRLVGMNYINEGTDEKLFEAHRLFLQFEAILNLSGCMAGCSAGENDEGEERVAAAMTGNRGRWRAFGGRG